MKTQFITITILSLVITNSFAKNIELETGSLHDVETKNNHNKDSEEWLNPIENPVIEGEANRKTRSIHNGEDIIGSNDYRKDMMDTAEASIPFPIKLRRVSGRGNAFRFYNPYRYVPFYGLYRPRYWYY